MAHVSYGIIRCRVCGHQSNYGNWDKKPLTCHECGIPLDADDSQVPAPFMTDDDRAAIKRQEGEDNGD